MLIYKANKFMLTKTISKNIYILQKMMQVVCKWSFNYLAPSPPTTVAKGTPSP